MAATQSHKNYQKRRYEALKAAGCCPMCGRHRKTGEKMSAAKLMAGARPRPTEPEAEQPEAEPVEVAETEAKPKRSRKSGEAAEAKT